MDAKTLKMISGGAFAVAVLSVIASLFLMVFASSYYKYDLGALTVATVSAPIIPLACIATCCFAKKDKLIGYALIIMALFFAASGISSISATTLSVSKTIASSFYFQAIGNFLFAIGALLGAISV